MARLVGLSYAPGAVSREMLIRFNQGRYEGLPGTSIAEYWAVYNNTTNLWHSRDDPGNLDVFPAGAPGDPAPKHPVEITEFIKFADGRIVPTTFLRLPICTDLAGTEHDYTVPLGPYSVIPDHVIQGTFQDWVQWTGEIQALILTAESLLASLTDVTITNEDPDGEWIELQFDDDPLASSGLNTTVSSLQAALNALTTRVTTTETNLTSATGRVTSAESAMVALDLRMDNLEATSGNPAVPVGTIQLWGADDPPSGWLECNGQSVSRAAYPELFGVLSVTFGALDGTHFNLPDLRGRVPVGAGTGTGLSLREIGDNGGEERHTLTIAEMPEHNHGIDHPAAGEPGLVLRSIVGQTTTVNTSDSTQSGTEPQVGFGDPGEPDPMTGIPLEGGGGAHNNMQPFTVLKFIIRAVGA